MNTPHRPPHRTLARARVALTATLVAVPAGLLAGCKSSASDVAPSTPATATTSTAAPLITVVAPTTLQPSIVATTAAAETTLRPTVITPEPAVPTTRPATLSTATRQTTSPPSTAAPTTKPTPATSDATAPSTSTASADEPYVATTPPTPPASTHTVPSSGSLSDGIYYATAAGAGGAAVTLDVQQLFVGQACTDHFGAEQPDACTNDYGVESSPHKAVTVKLTTQRITVVDAATQAAYRISGTELVRLLGGDTPSAAAPAGYQFTDFGWFVTVKGGAVTRLAQWWTP